MQQKKSQKKIGVFAAFLYFTIIHKLPKSLYAAGLINILIK